MVCVFCARTRMCGWVCWGPGQCQNKLLRVRTCVRACSRWARAPPNMLLTDRLRRSHAIHTRHTHTHTTHTQTTAVDFSLCEEEEDTLWQATHRETRAEIQARGRAFMAQVMARPETHIAVRWLCCVPPCYVLPRVGRRWLQAGACGVVL